MILYRWKHRGRSSLYKFPALNTVHFTIFDDVKSSYHALETIFTVYPTGNRSGPIFGKFWVKIGQFPVQNWKRIGHIVDTLKINHSCGPSGCVVRYYGPTIKRTTRAGTSFFNKFFTDLFLCGLIQVLNVNLKWYFLIEKLNRQKAINHNYFPMT